MKNLCYFNTNRHRKAEGLVFDTIARNRPQNFHTNYRSLLNKKNASKQLLVLSTQMFAQKLSDEKLYFLF